MLRGRSSRDRRRLREGWAVALLLLAGCGPGAHAPASTTSASEREIPPERAAEAAGASEAVRARMRDAIASPPDATCTPSSIYFEWRWTWGEGDEGEPELVRDFALGPTPEQRAVIEWDARCAALRGASAVELTGHVWAFGSDEYNLSLGEQLARSVASALEEAGVAGSAIRTRSLGEEGASGSDEPLVYTRDLRVDLAFH